MILTARFEKDHSFANLKKFQITLLHEETSETENINLTKGWHLGCYKYQRKDLSAYPNIYSLISYKTAAQAKYQI